MKTAIITGITGQTGSYLAEILLNKGYKIYGLRRRSSVFNTERIDHILKDPHIDDRLELVYGDLSDYASIVNIVSDVKPDLFLNEGAQSFVRVSFEIPEYTADVSGVGVIRCLEAIRKFSPKTKFLQASTSELFGNAPAPQNEKTIMIPRSPYGCAKLLGYSSVVNYREAYGLFAANSISFNHECISENTPIIIKKNDFWDVCSAANIIPLLRKGKNIQTFDLERSNIDIWDGNNWVKLKTITATKRNKKNPDHNMLSIKSRGGIINVTSHHTMLKGKDNYEEVLAKNLKISDELYLSSLPLVSDKKHHTIITHELAELLGLLASDGCVTHHHIQFTNNNDELIDRVSYLWKTTFLGNTTTRNGVSGLNRERFVKQTYLNGCGNIAKWIDDQIYTKKDRFKRVPPIILNSTTDIQKSFLTGYYAGDGLKKGKGESVATNSPFLAQGLVLLYKNQNINCSIYSQNRNNKTYYQINLKKENGNGTHLIKNPNEIMHIINDTNNNEWVFDLETESGLFTAGIGYAVVHNSPRRGEVFITRKVTRAATRIKFGLQDYLWVGNTSAKRNWNHCKDICDAKMLIIEADNPDDYVIGTEETHSVQELIEIVFEKLDLDWKKYTKIDERYLRPSEVENLSCDSSKIKNNLGWQPKYTFDQLVDEMVQHDLKLAKEEALILESRK